MLDLRIRGGNVVDGTGAPGRTADVGVKGGRIVAVGKVEEPARRTIDADRLVVAPGIVDIHTHYDAQLCWDPYATPSPLHGVTTVIAGNCGFTMAPAEPEDREYLSRLMSRVEGMPLLSLTEGVPWDWRTFAEYLGRFDGHLGVNAGFVVGHTTVRRRVMGPDTERAATAEEVAAMVRHFHEGMDAGGLGLSTSVSPTHNDADGRPVPSRFAERAEMLALCRAVRDHPGTTLEIVPPPGRFSDELVALMTDMSVTADRPINWNLLNVSKAMAADTEQRLSAYEHAAARGGCILGLVLPDATSMRLNFMSGFLLDALPVFSQLFELEPAERVRALASPEVRALLRRSEHTARGRALYYIVDWGGLTIEQTFAPSNSGLRGRSVAAIASERGVDPLDALLDVVVADELRTVITTPFRGADEESWQLRRQAVRDHRTIPGGSDSGAHLDMLDTFTLATRLLGPTVRDRGLFGLEEAVHLMTGAPAALYGLTERGRIVEGAWADLFVFDSETIDAGPVSVRNDLPGGASRLYGEAVGVHHVVVNGEEIVAGNQLTGALPGRVIRSGRDTRTVTAAEALTGDWRR